MKTKNFRKAMLLAVASLAILLIFGCGKGGTVIDNGGTPPGDGGQKPSVPVLGAVSVSQITSASATIRVPITSTGGAAITESGVTLEGNKVQAVLSGSEFSITLGNLTSNKTYIIKGYAINSAGVAYSVEVSFTTGTIVPIAGKIKDVDGNAYDTVRIGKQTWTVQNLRVKHYRDGSAIPVITDDNAWLNTDKGAMCYYNNDASNETLYGILYNQLAAADPKGIAPVGYHVPSLEEWEELWNYLGGLYVAGGHLKETGTTHWLSPNFQADNSTGFTALPGGRRTPDGIFLGIGESARWWSTVAERNAYCVNTGAALETQQLYNIHSGFYIRCLKDK